MELASGILADSQLGCTWASYFNGTKPTPISDVFKKVIIQFVPETFVQQHEWM